MNNSFSLNDVGIVIQGPTFFYKQILENIDYQFQYVWSTWSDEPIENLEEIKKKVKLIVSNKPNFTGLRNINLQCKSSEEGIRTLQKPWIIKIRSDLIWTNQKELIKKTFRDIIETQSFASFLNYKPSIQEMHDFITFSSHENGLKLWSYRQTNTDYNSPEKQLCSHLMRLLDVNYDEMVKKMSFCNIFMEPNKLDIYSLKYSVSLGEQCNSDLFGVPSFPKKYNNLC
jgi:hypothetical protein